MTQRTWWQALSLEHKLELYGAPFEAGMCKAMVGTGLYGIPSDGTPDATTAWQHTKHRFQGLWIPGALAYWTGGSHGHGHVAVLGYYKGHIRTVDYTRPGHWNSTTIPELEKAWPLIRWAGTALDINGRMVRGFPLVKRRWNHA